LVGGIDGVAGVYSLSQQRIIHTLKAGGPVTGAVWAGNRTVTSASTGVVKVFENGAEIASFNSHAGEVTALAAHPTGDIVGSVGVDKSYVLYDLLTLSPVAQIFGESSKHLASEVHFSDSQANLGLDLISAKFHPDGHLLAVGGTDGSVHVFDIKSGAVAASFPMSSPVVALCFSENGYFMAAVTEGSTSISVWDLRKSKLLKVLETSTKITSIDWDYTGQFLLSGGPNGVTVQQYTKSTKEWSEPLRSAVPATAVTWGSKAQGILAYNDQGILTVLRA
jgi:pre-mRNA-processing factor 19